MHRKAFALGLLSVSAISMAAVATNNAKPAAEEARAGPQPVRGPVLAQYAPAARPPASSRVQSSIARWNSLRQSDGLPFSSYASFLISHRGWPGETAMRNTAERAINPGSASPSDVVAYFRQLPPLSTVGHAQHALALQALGRTDEARQAARRAWHGGVLPQPEEQRLLSTFGSSLTQQDHDRRAEALLDNGDTVSARRILPMTSSARRAVYETRLALQTRLPEAASRVASLGSAAAGDAGLIMDRAAWLRETGQSAAARNFLAQRRNLATRPANVAKFYETMLQMARGAANDRQWTVAYRIASQLDDAYPAGTDISAQSYRERDHYTSLAWLAGMTALYQLRQPADAVAMFEHYARAARSPQTRAKGFYWAGRAASAAGQTQQATNYFQEAAANPDQFYGQLSLERLGRPVEAPAATPRVAPSASERAAFEQSSLVEAIRALGRQGQWNDQSLFIRALAEQISTEQERTLAGELGRQVGRLDLGVWVAREARNKGETFYAQSGFPQVPVRQSSYSTLAHAIMRQESSFDRAAVSHAGARGMMQLMPGTAREVSSRLGLSYDAARLTQDPGYNISLGTTYFAGLMDQWGNNVPLAVASYNAGPGNVRKWIRENGDPRLPGVDIVRWIEEIPFFETKNYVQRVLENAVVYDSMNPGRARSPERNRLSYYLGKNQPG